jgi:hypothetical protein
MLRKKEMTQKGTEMEAQEQRQVQDNGFSDLTDMKNEDFIYVY